MDNATNSCIVAVSLLFGFIGFRTGFVDRQEWKMRDTDAWRVHVPIEEAMQGISLQRAARTRR